MTTISDSSAISYARALEAAQHPEVADADLQESISQDDSGMTDCFSVEPDVLEGIDLEDLSPGDMVWPEDREPFIDDNGQFGWRAVVRGTSGDDQITVVYNSDGSADVTIKGETTHYSPEDAKNMRVDAGSGNDTVTVEDNRIGLCSDPGGSLTVDGGSGDDSIVVTDDTKLGGGGHITVNGGSGDDNVKVNDSSEHGGGDSIAVNGGTGDDHISGDLDDVDADGGQGHDIIEG